MPNSKAPKTILPKYTKLAFLPIDFHKTVIVAAFVAGPAIKNTRTAPGLTPANKSAAAIGTDPVAQTYKGIEATNMINIFNKGEVKCSVNKLVGTKIVIRTAIQIPTSNCLEISPKKSIKA